ncbi:MAG: hypothetical protein IRZ16_07820 [Myxococcaceae bacterium]|nr:hypothetical protein [Myxococcaceae bacterium]
MKRTFWAAVALSAALALVRCEPTLPTSNNGDGGATPTGDGGSPGTDSGSPDDGGPPDSGNDPGDGGGTDGGSDGGGVVILTFPNADGWTFYGKAEGGPTDVLGVTADEGGNIWVAGGEEGLFLLRKGASTFERFTMDDGLHPYGYMPDGSDAPGPHYLKVLSVAGGPAGTVFVGYAGRPPPPGKVDCESNWDGPDPDPSIYKSGDADKVTLKPDGGINVVHYDIFSGPNVVRDEPRGREKVCDILRIAYDKGTQSVWFGGNHGFAWGRAGFTGNPRCNGQLGCAGLFEHVHPAVCGTVGSELVLLTDSYYGVGVDRATGDVWFGGANRATRFKFGTYGDYWAAQVDTEAGHSSTSRIDVWPDAVPEDQCPTPAQRKDDAISGIAVMGDGSVWVSSFAWGLAHLDGEGHVLGYRSGDLIAPHVSALAADTDGSLWAGHRWGGGISRLQGGAVLQYGEATFGTALAAHPIWDIQIDRSGSPRRVLVAFRSLERSDGAIEAGAIGVFAGN